MLTIKELREDIRLAFSVFQDYVRPGGSLNLTDINVHAEDFVGGILNEVHGWRLVNTNQAKSNYPCIDLIDTQNRIGIQVTSEKGSTKVNNAIECLGKHGMSDHIDQFKLFSLVPKNGSYKITKTCSGVAFNWKRDVLDFDTLLRKINDIADVSKLQLVHTRVTSAMPNLFASRRDVMREIRSRLSAHLAIFSREVLDASFRYEDPLLMYKAIREMRIALQQNGSSYIENEVAARDFKLARKTLVDVENQVRDQFPDIHDAAMKGQSFVQYGDGDFGRAITLMMQIRAPIKQLVFEVAQELARIDAML